MKNKEQKVVYIFDSAVSILNDELREGWELINLFPTEKGAYALLAKEKRDLNNLEGMGNILCALADLGVSTLNNDGTIKSIEQIMEELGEAWDSKYL